MYENNNLYLTIRYNIIIIWGANIFHSVLKQRTLYLYVSELGCQYCNSFSSADVLEIIKHCKSCTYMPRPDLFRYKFVCIACSYHSYSSSPLKPHLAVHMGERPFKCDFCSFKSTTNKNLLNHIKAKHS